MFRRLNLKSAEMLEPDIAFLVDDRHFGRTAGAEAAHGTGHMMRRYHPVDTNRMVNMLGFKNFFNRAAV